MLDLRLHLAHPTVWSLMDLRSLAVLLLVLDRDGAHLGRWLWLAHLRPAPSIGEDIHIVILMVVCRLPFVLGVLDDLFSLLDTVHRLLSLLAGLIDDVAHGERVLLRILLPIVLWVERKLYHLGVVLTRMQPGGVGAHLAVDGSSVGRDSTVIDTKLVI